MTNLHPSATRRRRMSPLRKRTWLAVGAGGALVLSLAVGLAFQPWSPPEEVAVASGQPSSTPAALPEPDAETPRVAAAFAAWSESGFEDSGTRFFAEGGVAKNGDVSLRVDSVTPVDSAVHRSITQTVAVVPDTEYELKASVRAVEDGSGNPMDPVVVSIQLGAQNLELEPERGRWVESAWPYTTGPDETSVTLSVLVGGPTGTLQLDDLRMTAAAGADNAVQNGSFETYDAPTQISNESLILETGKAALSVAWRAGSISWSVQKPTGEVAADGDIATSNGLALVNLEDLSQGYYNVSLVGSESPSDVISTTVVVLDPTEVSSDDRFGVGVHFSHAVGDTAPKVARQIGFGNMRTDATWSYVEKVRGEFSFRADETAEMRAYADEGMAILPITDYGNDLYDDGRTPSSEEAIEAFANYTTATVAHLNAPSVEIYNEFNNPPMNTSACGTRAACYMPILEASYNKVKAANPAVNVVGPAIAHKDDAWLTELYELGGLQFLDAVSFHPYDYEVAGDPEFLVASLQQAEERIKEYNGGVEKPIWLTELGWSTGSLGEDAQAKFLVRAQTIALANNVEKYFWYDLVNDQNDPLSHEGNFGLVKQATPEVAALAPKPAGMAQALLIRNVAGKEFTLRDELSATTYSYQFGEGSTASRVAWSALPASVSYATAEPLTVASIAGEISIIAPIEGAVQLELTDVPVFITGAVVSASIVASE